MTPEDRMLESIAEQLKEIKEAVFNPDCYIRVSRSVDVPANGTARVQLPYGRTVVNSLRSIYLMSGSNRLTYICYSVNTTLVELSIYNPTNSATTTTAVLNLLDLDKPILNTGGGGTA